MSRKVPIRLPDGATVEVTDAGDAGLTDEQEAHYQQVAEEVLRKGGRPSLDGGEGVSPVISFRLPRDRQLAAKNLAAKRGVSVSRLARQLLERELDKGGSS